MSNNFKVKRNTKYDENWMDETLTKFPKIDINTKSVSQRHATIHKGILNDIRLRKQTEFNEKVNSIDRKINMKYLMRSNHDIVNMTRSKKPISKFLDKSIIGKIMTNVKQIRKLKDYDYYSGNILFKYYSSGMDKVKF